MLLLDHSKAFDTVCHEILILKLIHSFHFSQSAAKLIASYLYNRSQAVCVGDNISKFQNLSRGVPQGSVLGPLLFSLYINDIVGVPRDCEIHIYADDVQLCFTSNKENINTCVNTINENLLRVDQWATNNGLMLNPKKTKCLVISRNCTNVENLPNMYVNNCIIEYPKYSRNLGVIFDNRLSWNKHIDSTIGTIYGMLRSLWHIQRFIPEHIRCIIAKSYLLSKLLYCCEIYANCDSVHIRKLRVVTNDITRFVYGVKRYESVTAFSFRLYSMEFYRMLQFRCILMLHKIIYTREPKYLYERIMFSNSARLNCIKPVRYRYLISERQFFVYSVRLWNSLPPNLRFLSTFSIFKNNLFRHFTAPQ